MSLIVVAAVGFRISFNMNIVSPKSISMYVIQLWTPIMAQGIQKLMFSNFMVNVCASKLVTRREKGVSKLVTGKEKRGANKWLHQSISVNIFETPYILSHPYLKPLFISVASFENPFSFPVSIFETIFFSLTIFEIYTL